MTLLVPPLLPTWRYHRFFSPSSAATAWAPNRFARARAFLEGQGFRLKAGSLTGQQDSLALWLHCRTGPKSSTPLFATRKCVASCR